MDRSFRTVRSIALFFVLILTTACSGSDPASVESTIAGVVQLEDPQPVPVALNPRAATELVDTTTPVHTPAPVSDTAAPSAPAPVNVAAPEEPRGYRLHGETLMVYAPPNVSFGIKPHAEKTFFVWRAIDGTQPSARLGRKTTWDHSFNGELTDEIVGAGSSRSIMLDHATTAGAILGAVYFAHHPEKIIWSRRRYDAFEIQDVLARRTMIHAVTGSPPQVGQTVVGKDSGATGIVMQVLTSGTVSAPRYAVYYERTGGTITANRPTYFETDELMTWTGGQGLNAESAGYNRLANGTINRGTLVTFNNKITRIWPKHPTRYPNMYIGEQPHQMLSALEPEHDTSTHRGRYTPLDSHQSVSHRWLSELFLFHKGRPNTNTGRFVAERNGQRLFDQEFWVNGGTSAVDEPTTIFQSQVSNGAYPGAKRYMDYLYADDSDYYVRKVNRRGEFLLLPIASWKTHEVTLVDQPFLPDWEQLEVWVDGRLAAEIAR
jgi:hypothetical protein